MLTLKQLLKSFKVISKTSVESKTFDLKVGPQKGSGAGIVITRGKLPQHVEKEDADFRGKLKKVQKKVTLTKDNEGRDLRSPSTDCLVQASDYEHRSGLLDPRTDLFWSGDP